LLPTRQHCSNLNNEILNLLPSDVVALEAIDSVDCNTSTKIKANKKLSKLDDNSSRTAGLEKCIKVKINCKIMLQRNIDITNGLVNGAIGMIKDIISGVDGKPEKIKTIFNNRIYDLERVNDKFEIFHGAFVYRKQFPLTVAYGMTIHKSQGMSLENCIVDLGNSIFSCGQSSFKRSIIQSFQFKWTSCNKC